MEQVQRKDLMPLLIKIIEENAKQFVHHVTNKCSVMFLNHCYVYYSIEY